MLNVANFLLYVFFFLLYWSMPIIEIYFFNYEYFKLSVFNIERVEFFKNNLNIIIHSWTIDFSQFIRHLYIYMYVSIKMLKACINRRPRFIITIINIDKTI